MTETLTLEAVAERARAAKTELVAKYRPGDPEQTMDLTTHAIVVRAGVHIALVEAGPTGPLGPRRACYLAASLMRPDELYVITETVSQAGIAAGDLVERWNAGDRKGLSETLMVHRYVGGTLVQVIDHPYTRMGALVTWREPEPYDDVRDWGGALGDEVARGWAKGLAFWKSHNAATGIPDGLDGPMREHFIDHMAAAQASGADHGRVVLLECGDMFLDGVEQ